jgi:phosphoribosylanthranilate isomerase
LRVTVRIKICGIRTAPTYRACLDAGADYIGFVFFPPSPRAVQPSEAAALAGLRPQSHCVRHVGLFVNPDDRLIERTLAEIDLDILQLTDVTPERSQAIRARFERPVWRSIPIATRTDLPTNLSADFSGADALLLDAAAISAPLPGGNGVSFDWSLLNGWAGPPFWLLAGGLNPDNVAQAIRRTGAPAVDVSSGVERERGVKDEASIHAFIQNARAA